VKETKYETEVYGKKGTNKIAGHRGRGFAECNVQGGVEKRPQDFGACFGQNANALYSNFAGRYGYSRNVTL